MDSHVHQLFRLSDELAGRTVTEVVPSPTSLSWTLDISTSTLAAGLSTPTDRRIVAPSLVTSTVPLPLPIPHRILSMPLGPRVDLTRSPMAMAPTKLERRATSAFSSSAPCLNIRRALRLVIFLEVYALSCRSESSNKSL